MTGDSVSMTGEVEGISVLGSDVIGAGVSIISSFVAGSTLASAGLSQRTFLKQVSPSRQGDLLHVCRIEHSCIR